MLIEDPETHRISLTALPRLNPVRRILIVGSTGSIGTQALDVIERGDDLELVGLAAASSWELLLEQARRHGVDRVALADPDAAARAGEHSKCEVLAGPEGLVELITDTDCDLVLNALVGSAGLGPTVATLGEGIDLALANKESLVVGGELVTALAEATGAQLIPVDSEHSALQQLISGERPGTIDRLVLTASGGPFRGRTDLDTVTAEEALAHPTWDMGGKITIDSATLMNKGLELIEAHHLFEDAVRADRRGRAPAVDRARARPPQRRRDDRAPWLPGHARAHLLRPELPRAGRRAGAGAGPGRSRRADLRGARYRDVRLPAARARGRPCRRHGPLRPERGQRGGGPRLSARRAVVHGHRARDRVDALRAARPAGAALQRPVRGRCDCARSGKGVAA